MRIRIIYGKSLMNHLQKRLQKAMKQLDKKYGLNHGIYSDSHPRNIVLNRWFDWKRRQTCR